jgi:hypothetical protein
MRVSPVGWAFTTLDDTFGAAAESSRVTHNHPEGIKGAQATAAAVFLARTGHHKAGIRKAITEHFGYDLDRTVDAIRPTYRFNETCQGTVPEAIVAFHDATDFEDTVRNAVSLGGDTDTLACIAGGSAHAYFGSVPRHLADAPLASLPELLRDVIVTEDITNRFFNVIALLNRAVPITVVQLNVLKVEDKFVLNFLKVLDIAELYGEEEPGPSDQVDQGYWERRTNPASLDVVDRMVGLVTAAGKSPRVTYNKYHIPLGTTGRNFAWFSPRKSASHCHMHVILDGEERARWVQQLDEAGIFGGPRGNSMKMRIGLKESESNEEPVARVLEACEQNSVR